MAEKHIIKVTSDTVNGPVEHEINLDELPLERVFELVKLMPDLAQYYGERLLKQKDSPTLYSSDGNEIHPVNEDDMVPLFIFWDKELGKVAGLLGLFGKNLLIRADQDWSNIKRQHPKIEDFFYNPKFRAFQIDWEKEPLLAGEADPSNEEEWEHQLVQLWDQNTEIPFDLLPRYAIEVDPEEIASLL
jgi:hypothetical protein